MRNTVILFLLIISLLSFWLLTSCIKPNCELLAKDARQNECFIILTQKPPNGPYQYLEGKSLKSGENCSCKDNGRWWSQYRDYMQVGDTIIKRKGELVFSIHKKDTVLSFPWQCEGKVYK
jgi:hypothetical protein